MGSCHECGADYTGPRCPHCGQAPGRSQSRRCTCRTGEHQCEMRASGDRLGEPRCAFHRYHPRGTLQGFAAWLLDHYRRYPAATSPTDWNVDSAENLWCCMTGERLVPGAVRAEAVRSERSEYDRWARVREQLVREGDEAAVRFFDLGTGGRYVTEVTCRA